MNQFMVFSFEGNLGSAPEMRYNADGNAVVNFRVAHNRSWTTKSGDKKTQTTWFKVSAWGKLAEVINQYCEVGSTVIISGRLNPDENGGPKVFEKKDGTYGAAYEVTANEVRILKGKAGAGSGTAAGPNEPAAEEDIPF